MKNYVFEIIDKTGRRIRLTKKQWTHIMESHAYMHKYLEEVIETLRSPDKIIKLFKKGYYYKNYKYLNSPNRFVMVTVKYLNNHGFVITTYLTGMIR